MRSRFGRFSTLHRCNVYYYCGCINELIATQCLQLQMKGAESDLEGLEVNTDRAKQFRRSIDALLSDLCRNYRDEYNSVYTATFSGKTLDDGALYHFQTVHRALVKMNILVRLKVIIEGIFWDSTTSLKSAIELSALKRIYTKILIEQKQQHMKSSKKVRHQVGKQLTTGSKNSDVREQQWIGIYNFGQGIEVSAELREYFRRGYKEIARNHIQNKKQFVVQCNDQVRHILRTVLYSELPACVKWRVGRNVTVREMLVLANLTGGGLCEKMISFYEEAVEMLPDHVWHGEFEEDLPDPPSLPAGHILLRADKNIGSVLVPVDWVKQELARQVELGGYIKHDLSPESVMAMMLRDRLSLISNLTDDAQKYLRDLGGTRRQDPEQLGLMRIQVALYMLYLN